MKEVIAEITHRLLCERARGYILGHAFGAGTTLTYRDLAQGIDLQHTRGHAMSRATEKILSSLAEYDIQHKLPITSSLVVNGKTGIPGNGYFTLLTNRGIIKAWPETPEDRYNEWRISLREFPQVTEYVSLKQYLHACAAGAQYSEDEE